MPRGATVLLLSVAGLALAGPPAEASSNPFGLPASAGAPQIGSAPDRPQPVYKRRPTVSEPASTTLRTDTVVLGSNVGPVFGPSQPLEPYPVYSPPVIPAPPNWRGTEGEWEDHVKLCDAQVGEVDWFTGEYIATTDLQALCPFDRGAEGPPVITARTPHGTRGRAR
jgi:hypothetical protein